MRLFAPVNLQNPPKPSRAAIYVNFLPYSNRIMTICAHRRQKRLWISLERLQGGRKPLPSNIKNHHVRHAPPSSSLSWPSAAGGALGYGLCVVSRVVWRPRSVRDIV
ncbi:hypothetical protein BSKO_06342 [Bryopsis sp. KO-2023]|nr:hypothetical protein BSKO_06342 [Bryopsis sp. KO-2023]